MESRRALPSGMRKFQSSYDLLEAIDARGRFDLYLLDILMPEVNGIEAGAAIRHAEISVKL